MTLTEQVKSKQRTAKMVLLKAEQMQCYLADGSKSTFVILLSGNAENPRLGQHPIRW